VRLVDGAKLGEIKVIYEKSGDKEQIKEKREQEEIMKKKRLVSFIHI